MAKGRLSPQPTNGLASWLAMIEYSYELLQLALLLAQSGRGERETNRESGSRPRVK